MELINSKTAQLRRLKTRITPNGWYQPSCQMCDQKFHNGMIRYEWRLKAPLNRGYRQSSTFWTVSCKSCLKITLKAWHHSLDNMFDAI